MLHVLFDDVVFLTEFSPEPLSVFATNIRANRLESLLTSLLDKLLVHLHTDAFATEFGIKVRQMHIKSPWFCWILHCHDMPDLISVSITQSPNMSTLSLLF